MNKLKVYINGALWGIKISIKIMSRVKDINKAISILCNIQDIIKDDTQFEGDNIKLWDKVNKVVCNLKYVYPSRIACKNRIWKNN